MTILKKGILFVLLSLYLLLPVCAQTPSYYHYTTTDGLASSTVFQIIQDKDGFIWFATLNGISRFDGKRFTTYRTKDGLNSNSIISLAAGEKGELYIGNYENGINVFKNGKIENYFSERKGQQFPISYLLMLPSGKDSHELYAYKSWANVQIIQDNLGGKPSFNSIMMYPVLVNKLAKLPGGEIIALTESGLYNIRNDSIIKLHISNLPDSAIYCLEAGDNGNYFIGTRGTIYKIGNNKVLSSYKIKIAGHNDVTEILRDKNNNLWFSIMNKGFFFIPEGTEKIIDIGNKIGLLNTLVNNFLQDNEGNIWISTFGKGVYCLNNLYLKSFNENDGMSSNSVYSIAKAESGRMLIGTFNGVNILDNGKFGLFNSNPGRALTEYIHNIKLIGSDFYICGSFGGKEIKEISYKGLRMNMINQLSFCKTRDGLNLFGNAANCIYVRSEFASAKKGSSNFFIFGDSLKLNRINEIIEDSHANLWIGTNFGLCKLSNQTVIQGKVGWKKTFFPGDQVLNSRINSIFQDTKNHVWFACEKGIASYDLDNDSVKSDTNLNGYDLSSSTSITSDNKNRIWIGNMKGLYLFDGSSVKYLNSQTGLPSDEVLSLYYDKTTNTLFIGTSNGISLLDINMFDQYIPEAPNVKIVSVNAGDSVYTSNDHLVFKPDQHDIYISFKAQSFSSPGSVKYKYSINGEWMSTDYDFLNFISLKPGKYELEIIAKAQNTDWGLPVSVNFHILPRFIDTFWFKLLLISIFLVAAHFIAKLRLSVHNTRNREELELSEKINELRHKALSAMMNPHFISNSLNSVQYLVNSKQYEEANDYIAMMAKLMRRNLDTAGRGFILLSEEIERLKLYLNLEKLRFRENFTFEIRTGKDVDANGIMIPNMIIQPFVENSLWHGIIDSGKPGLLTVFFTFEEVDNDSYIYKSLVIKVTDNGIGIKEARKTKNEDHISKGIQIVEERLSLLCAKLQLPQPIMFEDLSSRDSDSHGTEVIISLPPQLYKISIPE